VVVIPCYNEERRLAVDQFRDFLRRHADICLLMVNDGSGDNTLAILRQLQEEHGSQVLLHDLPQNMGKAEAVRQGMLKALLQRPDFVAYWDADLATPLEAVCQFRDVLIRCQGIQLVVGSRLPLLGRRIERNGRRNILGRSFAVAASAVLGVNVRDTQCGAKMFRVTPLVEAAFGRSFLSRWIFDVEILARILGGAATNHRAAANEIIYELPLEHWAEVSGSKLKSRDCLTAIWDLARIYAHHVWRRGEHEGRPEPVTIPFPTVQLAEASAELPAAAPSEAWRRAA
jgi:glycosyltransferase involved in cell wall biosynthesis